MNFFRSRGDGTVDIVADTARNLHNQVDCVFRTREYAVPQDDR